jgi:hypothetical protein
MYSHRGETMEQVVQRFKACIHGPVYFVHHRCSDAFERDRVFNTLVKMQEIEVE